MCVPTPHHIVMPSSMDSTNSTMSSPFWPPIPDSKESALLTHLIPKNQQGQYANNPQLAKHLDPPFMNVWGLII